MMKESHFEKMRHAPHFPTIEFITKMTLIVD